MDMTFTAADVKKLREMTGAGMMACKEALKESGGDTAGAVDFLRKKGLAAVQKRQARIAAEGVIVTLVKSGRAVVLEVNCETDFVSKGDDFRSFADSVADYVLSGGVRSLDDLRNAKSSEANELTLKCGEKIAIRRFKTMDVPKGVIGSYNHGGRIGVLVGLEPSADIGDLAKDVAMHIAAADPKFIDSGDIDEGFKEKEAEIYAAQLREQGKPESMIDKIVQGKLKKLATEVCLLQQKFIKDQDKTVGQLIKGYGDIKISGFFKMNLGEGIEKREESLASEVAKIVK